MKSKRDQFIPVEERDLLDGADLLDVTNGTKSLQVTRKAFDAVYASRGFVLAGDGGKDQDTDKASDGAAVLSPQQKAAQTKKANQLKAEQGGADAADADQDGA